MGIVTHLHCSHLQVLHSLIKILHVTQHTTVDNQPPAQAKDFHVMSHSGKDMISTNVVMAGLKCSRLRSSEDKDHHHQVHQDGRQNHWGTIQSIHQHLQALILHHNLLPVHYRYPSLAS